MNSITLGGVRDVDLGFRVLEESQEPLMPSTRDKGMNIDGRHGTYDFGAELEPRLFSFQCAFIPNGTNYDNLSAEELQRCVRRLAQHLTDSYGRPRNMLLHRFSEPDKHYVVRYSGNSPLDRIAYSTLGFFTLPLVAFDPFAYGNQEQIYEDIMRTSPYKTDIESLGNVRTPLVIVLTNEGANTITRFKITNEYKLE
ncbi:phage tail domain-containing protein [Paenibacillus filicis]|uniref:Phage tail domain-containing protein n=1 Tax=Paenibacillus filicis TaxID=669464 RepID=A0ABU9DVJ3_9BACL